jgi:hypothetical protein
MSRFLALAIGSMLALPAAGQFRPDLSTDLSRGFGGVSSDQFYQSQVQHAANQLLAELNSVRTEVSRLRESLAVKMELSRLADQAVRDADALRRLAATTADKRRLIRADERVDASVDAFMLRAGQLSAGSTNLSTAITRAQYADQQLHAALGFEDGAGGLTQIVRTASAVVDQTTQLRHVASNSVDAVGYTRQLDRQVRAFGITVDQLRRRLEGGGTLQAAVTDYQQASQQWANISPSLAQLATDAAVRIQIARVESLFRQLGDQLQVGGGPDPNQPGFGFLTRGMFAVGAGEGGGPRVCVFGQIGDAPLFDFFAFDPNYRGGVRVAVADLNGDRIPDIVAAPGGPRPGQRGMPPLVRVFNGRTLGLMSEFLAYNADWTGGLFVAAADRTRQGRAIVVTGADVGATSHVKAFDLRTGKELSSFNAYDQNFRGGVRVALGDVDGDGLPDIVTAPGPQHVPQVKVFAGTNGRVLADFLAYDQNHIVGAWVATADITKNGRADVIVGPDVQGSGVVRVFDPIRGRKLGEVAPYPGKFRGGVRVAAHDVNSDGVLDIVCAPGPDYPVPVRVFDGRNSKPLVEFYPFERTFGGGAFIGAK